MIQDKGCVKSVLPKETYHKSQMPPFGTKDNSVYYWGLTYITIDYIWSFNSKNALGDGWEKLPKNRTDMK